MREGLQKKTREKIAWMLLRESKGTRHKPDGAPNACARAGTSAAVTGFCAAAFADDPGAAAEPSAAEAGVEEGRAVFRRFACPCSFFCLRRLTAMLLRRRRRSSTEVPALMSRRLVGSAEEDMMW